MSVRVLCGGEVVAYAPVFDTRAEAEAWVSEVGERGGWDERVEIVSDDYEGWCDSCTNFAVLTTAVRSGEQFWWCVECAE